MCWVESFQFDIISLAYFYFCFLCFQGLTQNFLCPFQCPETFPYVCPNSFIASGLTFEPLTHFKLTFVYCETWLGYYSFILLHVDIQFSSVIEATILSLVCVLRLVGLLLSFYSVPLVCLFLCQCHAVFFFMLF